MITQNQTITAIRIEGHDVSKGRFGSEMHALLSNGATKHLFNFFDDELSFTADELCGLTVDQALKLRQNKDIEYLQS